MRISDWSSDVCSSDLRRDPNGACSRNRESQGEQANITETGPQDKAACKSSSHSQATSRSPTQWEPNAAPSHLDRPEPEDWFQSVSAFRAHLMQILSPSPRFDQIGRAHV